MKLVINDKNVIMDIAEQVYYAKVEGEGELAHLEECIQEEATHIYLPIKNCAYMSNMGTIIDLKEIPNYVVAYDYKYENGEFKINNSYRIKSIIKELEELDKTINRATEDLYKAIGVTPYKSILEVIEKKNKLRAELAALPKE